MRTEERLPLVLSLSLLDESFLLQKKTEVLKVQFIDMGRLGGDLIDTLKWYRGYENGDIHKILKISNHDRIRNNGFMLEKNKAEKIWFLNRMIDE